jgi:heterotetrameric sarcosine oxidase gamma subunit
MAETPFKVSPLYNVLRQSGGRFVIQDGWYVADSLAGIEDKPTVAHQGVFVVDESHRGKIMIHGESGDRAVASLNAPSPQLVGHGIIAENLIIIRLRRDQLFINTPPGEEQEILNRLTNSLTAIGPTVTLTDMTQGRFQLRLVGAASSRVLGRICGIDFHPENFPNLTAVQTSVAKTTQLIIREDAGGVVSFSIIGARSLAEYLWTILMDSGQNYGIQPAGQQLIRALRSPGENQSPVNSE